MAIEQLRDETSGQLAPVEETDSIPPPSESDPALETLREILFSHYRQRIGEMEAELDNVERRIYDKDALVAMVTPILGDAIRRKIRDAREEMIEALSPIIGQIVMRAVSEAIRDLARTIDAQRRTLLNPQVIGRRLWARASGVSSAEMVLRESLPFNVTEVFLIHRESGLLLWHISRDPDLSPDSDLISGMLTAIRDFVRESFGRGKVGQLDEIQYGEQSILIEAAQHAYLAVVVEGIEPPGFRSEIRQRLYEVSYAHEDILEDYEGDASPLAPVDQPLRSLITSVEQQGLSSTQKRVLVGILGLAGLCLAATCLAGFWTWQYVRSAPPPLVVIQATASPTFTATPTPTSTSLPTFTPIPTTATPTPTTTLTPTPTPSGTPTSTYTPTPPVVGGSMAGDVWLRIAPSNDSSRIGIVLERGQPVEVLAVFGGWYQVRWAPQAHAEVIGWTPAQWVNTTDSIPAQIVTPASGP